MRTTFIQQLITEARSNPKIFLMVGDLGYSVVEPFAREFPDRFLNAGVAEQNMTGVAAGLASEGYHVFTYSIANFPTFRCAEQIRNDVAYHGLPVTIVSVGGGLAYGNLGYSHHAIQDYALLRTFPGMLMASPGDPYETAACVRYLCLHGQTSYLRLGKAGEPIVHKAEPSVYPDELVFDKDTESVATDSRKLVLTTGATLKLAKDAIAGLTGEPWRLASLPLWSERGKGKIAKQLSAFDHVVTVEDHLEAAGFGSYIRELTAAMELRPRVDVMALDPKICGQVAAQGTLNRLGGISVDAIRERLVSVERLGYSVVPQ